MNKHNQVTKYFKQIIILIDFNISVYQDSVFSKLFSVNQTVILPITVY
jgi:hypothetical protein